MTRRRLRAEAGSVRPQHTGASASHEATPPLPLDVAPSRRQETGSEVGFFCFVLLEGVTHLQEYIPSLKKKKKILNRYVKRDI